MAVPATWAETRRSWFRRIPYVQPRWYRLYCWQITEGIFWGPVRVRAGSLSATKMAHRCGAAWRASRIWVRLGFVPSERLGRFVLVGRLSGERSVPRDLTCLANFIDACFSLERRLVILYDLALSRAQPRFMANVFAKRFQAVESMLRIVEDTDVVREFRSHGIDLILAVWICLVDDLGFERTGVIPGVPGPEDIRISTACLETFL